MKKSLMRILSFTLCMILAVSLLGASGVDALAEDSMNSAGQDAVIDIQSAQAQAPVAAEPASAPAPAPAALPASSGNSAEALAASLRANLPAPPAVDITSWQFVLANPYNSIGVDTYPETNYIEGQEIGSLILEPAVNFLSAAREAGYSAWISVAYRNSEYIGNIYRRFLWGEDPNPVRASTVTLAPGCSDHQTGLAIDFTDNPAFTANYNEFEDGYMGDTELYRWLKEHCAEYGFIERYPAGKEEFYGLCCEHPAHFRYVGQEAAKYITENNLCLEEFLMLYDEGYVYLPEAGAGLRISERR